MSIRVGTYKIQVKRTQKAINNSDITNAYLEFGEPFYMNNGDYFMVGPQSSNPSVDNKIPSLKVIKAVNRVKTDADNSSVTIPVADNGVFYKNKVGTSVTLMDSQTNKLYPETKIELVKDQNGTAVATLISNKVDIDTASQKVTTLGYDSGGVYVDEEVIDTTNLPDSLVNLINNKVSIDSESDPDYSPLSLGQDLIGTFVRINDGLTTDSDFIQSYLDNRMAQSLVNINSQLTILQQLINTGVGVSVGRTAPAESNKLWIDTTAVTGGLKYYDNNALTWKHVPVAYT